MRPEKVHNVMIRLKKKDATPCCRGGCKEKQMVEAAGIEPASCDVFRGSRSVRSR